MPTDSTTIDATRTRLREQMPITEKWAYYDHAAVSPLTRPAHQAMNTWLQQATYEGDTVWLDWSSHVKNTRAVAAELINAYVGEIALLPSTTAGINLVAEGLEWKPGDNVVTLDDEFPSNLFPWMHLERLGVETRLVPTTSGHVDLDQLANYCDERTRVVTVSWVGYANGCRRDIDAIAEIAHQHEALFFLDAIQGMGVFPIDVKKTPVDCLAADGHKWMLGPEAAGIAYVSKSALEQLTPIGVGWNSVVHAWDYGRLELELKPDASRYEGGTQNMAGFIALGASMKLLSELGTDHIAAAILENTDLIAEELSALGAVLCSPRSAEASSGIVSVELPGADPMAVRRQLLEQGVAVACRAGRIRVSAHAYNNDDDRGRLVKAMKTALG